jgi:glutamate synthase (NADPH/NADH)
LGLQANFIKAVGVGVLKVMAKMGISTLQSYKGAQIFEALGLGEDIMAMCFPETSSRIGGLSLQGLGRNMLEAHLKAFESLTNREDVNAKAVPDPGEYLHRVNQDGSSEVLPFNNLV